MGVWETASSPQCLQCTTSISSIAKRADTSGISQTFIGASGILHSALPATAWTGWMFWKNRQPAVYACNSAPVSSQVRSRQKIFQFL